MPTYELECDTCGDRQVQILKISDYDTETLNEKQCLGTECEGTYEQVFNTAPGHCFKGPGWTPKFHR